MNPKKFHFEGTIITLKVAISIKFRKKYFQGFGQISNHSIDRDEKK